ncbi:hypothetical protein [Hyphomonas sp.]|uniref:hypothetical protein n=1 Tax=Hyphomonas sp. TaxID=87 RepID=UPI00356635CC
MGSRHQAVAKPYTAIAAEVQASTRRAQLNDGRIKSAMHQTTPAMLAKSETRHVQSQFSL